MAQWAVPFTKKSPIPQTLTLSGFTTWLKSSQFFLCGAIFQKSKPVSTTIFKIKPSHKTPVSEGFSEVQNSRPLVQPPLQNHKI